MKHSGDIVMPGCTRGDWSNWQLQDVAQQLWQFGITGIVIASERAQLVFNGTERTTAREDSLHETGHQSREIIANQSGLVHFSSNAAGGKPLMRTSSCQRGVTLIEVLVAVLILSLGLLGIAALQTKSLSMNHSAYLRSQANSMAYDVIDRMRANRSAAMSGDYNHQLQATAPAGGGVASTDMNDWLSDLAATLPEGLGGVKLDGHHIRVTVQWRDRDGETQSFVTVTDL